MKTRYKDYTNEVIGKLTVLGRAENKINCNGQSVIRWKCECECGEIVLRYSAHLKRGRCKCLTCKAKEEHEKYGYKDIRAHHWYNIKKEATKRNLEFNITMEYVWDLFKKQNEICALSGIPIHFAKNRKSHIKGGTSASLDRIDSLKGYIEGNVQWTHKWINVMKSNYAEEEFYFYCSQVTAFSKVKYDKTSTSV